MAVWVVVLVAAAEVVAVVLAAAVAAAVVAAVPLVAGKIWWLVKSCLVASDWGLGANMQNKFKQLTGIAALEGQWLRRRHFDESVLAQVAERIRQSESEHSGELVVAVEAMMPSHEKDAHLRALEVYGRLRVWDTPLNSGVLLYLALDKRAIEIIADRGIDASSAQWQQVCADLQTRLAKGEYVEGLMAAVDAIQTILKTHAPHSPDHQTNALPDMPVVL
ncbi:TPM domain-containing protein [Oceanisphaera sp. W20_SRM_FM3]|uniref:TPM domain-containing protein n=1 Tax=Oceanisphaera sp. W20_SRM_FM3 TaxID=3240267 RepID=UPI003F948028